MVLDPTCFPIDIMLWVFSHVKLHLKTWFYLRGEQTETQGNIDQHVFCAVHKLRVVFTLKLNSWKNKNDISQHMKRIWNSDFSVYKWNCIGTRPAHPFPRWLWWLLPHKGSWVIVMETVWSLKPEVFTIWLLTEKVHWPLSYIIT